MTTYREGISYRSGVGYRGSEPAVGSGPLWQPAFVTAEDWGRLRVTIGRRGSVPTDVTFLRDVPVAVESFSYADPFGPETAVIRFPQFTPFELPGAGDLSWLSRWARVNIERVHPDGSTSTLLWPGHVVAWDFEASERDAHLTLTCVGTLHQLMRFKRLMGSNRNTATLEAILANEYSMNSRVSLDFDGALSVSGGPTGFSYGNRPHGMPAIDYVRDLLSRSVVDTSGDQWTVHADGRVPLLVKRSAYGSTWTYTVGTQGLSFRLSQDHSQGTNVIYGEGVDTAGGGGKWRNYYSLPSTPVNTDFFQPIGYATNVHGFDEVGDGTLTDNSVRVDATEPRWEQFVNFGEGYSLTTAKTLAARLIERDKNPGWVGAMTARVDPEEGSRMSIREGDRISLKHHTAAGTTTTLYVSRVELRKQGDLYAAELTVSERPADSDLVQRIIDRNRSGQDPARRLQLGRQSFTVADSKFPWDDSNGAGWYPRARKFDGTSTVSLGANAWTVTEIVGSEGPDTIIKTEFRSNTSTTVFAVAICDWNVNPANLPANPLTATTDWFQNVPGILYAAGMSGQRAGYYPSTEAAGGGVTGVHIDEDAWSIHHSRGTPSGAGDSSNSGGTAKLWVAVFPSEACNMHGRLYHGTE